MTVIFVNICFPDTKSQQSFFLAYKLGILLKKQVYFCGVAIYCCISVKY